jgi:sugar lactone lactonase YvrE
MRRIRLILAVLVIMAFAAAGMAADLQYPLSIAVSGESEIYLADRDLPGVWRLKEGTLSVLSQGKKIFRTPLNAIRCVAIGRDGKLLAGDSSTREVYRFSDQGQPIGLTHKPGAKNAAKAGADVRFGQIGIPMDIAVSGNGDLLVSDLELHRIVKVPAAGGDPVLFVATQAPRGLCFDGSGSLWAVSARQLIKVSATGEKTTVVPDGTLEFPHTVAVGADGTAFVCDGYAKAIWRIGQGGKPEKLVSGAPFVNPVGMRLANDKLFVVDPHAKAVFQVTLDGKISTVVAN